VRPLLRWTSLAATAVALAALGVARTHQHNFPLFLSVLMGMAILIVAAFIATAPGRSPD
jgi:hypothetical protein